MPSNLDACLHGGKRNPSRFARSWANPRIAFSAKAGIEESQSGRICRAGVSHLDYCFGEGRGEQCFMPQKKEPGGSLRRVREGYSDVLRSGDDYQDRRVVSDALQALG